MQKYLFICSLFFAFIFNGCKKEPFAGKIYQYTKELVATGKYSNETGNNPKLFDFTSSKGFSADFSKAKASKSGDDVFLTLDGVRFKDELGVYEVYSIVTEEQRNGLWIEDKEFKLQEQSISSMDFVLVIDCSSSLGSDFESIKTMALSFLTTVSGRVKNAKVGIVAFNKDIKIFKIQSDFSAARAFINGMTQDKDTRLYEALNTGYNMLKGSNANSKAIITFTDGYNNSWSNENLYRSSTYVKSRLDSSSSVISSYTIGFEGEQDALDQALGSLAVGDGFFNKAGDIESLSKIFDRVARSVAEVYTLTYRRNASKVTTPVDIRFRVKVNLL